jgi:hypothetical protein
MKQSFKSSMIFLSYNHKRYRKPALISPSKVERGAIDKKQSQGQYGAYSFKLEVPGYGTYLGQAVSHEKTIAIHFALTDPTTKDYGTGIAMVSKNKAGKMTFHKYYYEPEFKGCNYGFEDCVKR